MSIEVIYQGLTIAKGPAFRLQDGGVFVELDGPMPVATQLSLTHGENALHGRVRRVTEGAGAGMLIVPTASPRLPRWLMPLGPTSVTNVELEPEPTAPAVEAAPTTPSPPAAAANAPVPAIRVGEPSPSGESPAGPEAAASGEAGHDAGEAAAASGTTPSEPGEAAKDDDEDDKHPAKSTDKKAPAAGTAAKKKKPRKR